MHTSNPKVENVSDCIGGKSIIKEQTHFCLLNIHSIKNKTLEFKEFVTDNDFDIIALTETWLKSDDDFFLNDMCPENYSVKHIPRITNTWGGGVAIVYKSCLNIKITEQFKYNSFEHIEVVFTSGSFAFRIVVIYRPPPSATNKFTEKMFVNDFQDYIEKLYSKSGKLALVGDFNFHVENTETCSQFLDIFHDFNLKQHINEPTHKDQGTLDLIITRDSDDIIAEICVTNPLLSDHFAVECSILAKINIPTKSVISFRKLKSIDIGSFKRDIENSELINENENIESMISKFNSVLEKILNNHAPIIHKLVPIHTIVPWVNDEIKHAKAH